MSSIVKNIFSFDRLELTEIGLRSIAFTVPGAILLASVRLFSQEVHPQFTKRESIDEAGSTNFIITTYNKTSLEKVVKLFMEKLPEDLRTTDLQKRYVTDLTDFRTMALEAAKALKCEKIDIGFSFSDASEKLPMEPYMAIGGQTLSYYSNPFMSLHLNAATEAQNLLHGVRLFSPNAKKFISAHEVGHIASDHALAQCIATFAYGLFNAILWQQCWSKGYSLGVIFGMALTAAFIYQIFYSAFVRYQEKQADLMACNALQNNKEALDFFQAIIELRQGKPNVVDVGHPPIPERINYTNAWKKKGD